MTWPQNIPDTPYDPQNRANWMSQLPDDEVLVRDLSIPGTHDSASKKGYLVTSGLSIHVSETRRGRSNNSWITGSATWTCG